MVRERGMGIPCNSGRGGKMNFYIQASNPKSQYQADDNDKTLSEAIETTFLLNTENAILMWNYISIPLSYKYDISYMMEDILEILNNLQNKEKGEIIIHWLPDTFRSDWIIRWEKEKLEIYTQWESTVGNLEKLLNEKPNISLLKNHFIREWKSILGIVIKGLRNCGYDTKKIINMNQLIEQYRAIKEFGILYKV